MEGNGVTETEHGERSGVLIYLLSEGTTVLYQKEREEFENRLDGNICATA